jgi:ribosomal protein S27AE
MARVDTVPSRAVHRRPASSAEGLEIIQNLPSETFCPDCGVLSILRPIEGDSPGIVLPAKRECRRCGRCFRVEWKYQDKEAAGDGVVCRRMYGPTNGPRVDINRV